MLPHGSSSYGRLGYVMTGYDKLVHVCSCLVRLGQITWA